MNQQHKSIQAAAKFISEEERKKYNPREIEATISCPLFPFMMRKMWVRLIDINGKTYAATAGCEHCCDMSECNACMGYVKSQFEEDPNRDAAEVFHIPTPQETT